MEALGLSRIGFFLFLFSLGFFGKKETLEPVPLVQRAVVTEHQAIVYKQPDFDAEANNEASS